MDAHGGVQDYSERSPELGELPFDDLRTIDRLHRWCGSAPNERVTDGILEESGTDRFNQEA